MDPMKPTGDPALRGLEVYGPDANCTLTPGPLYCLPVYSVYQYRPALSANITFLVLFSLALFIHVGLGIKYRTVTFATVITCGCLSEIIGYAGRIMLYQNPFTFTGFLMQIICITFGPTWFTAAIYLTLSKIVIYLGPEYSRFSPKFYYWAFIPCDILSLVLQAVGGALSSTSSGGSRTAVDVSIAGLSFQVFTLCVFIGLVLEYAYRYRRASKGVGHLTTHFKIFSSFLALAILLILIRCAYRIDELSDGYQGPLIHNEGLFIGLEGVMVVVAIYCLIVAHPGPIFKDDPSALSMGERTTEPRMEDGVMAKSG
ncbi:hypothetical protein ACLMJK_001395 [Lecanora helva]